MNPEQERQAQEKPLEDSIRQIEEDLRFLNWQVSKLGKMIRTALEQFNALDLATS